MPRCGPSGPPDGTMFRNFVVLPAFLTTGLMSTGAKSSTTRPPFGEKR